MNSEQEFAGKLEELLDTLSFDDEFREQTGGFAFEDCDVRSFDNAGLLTDNKGLVVRLKNGAEFQLQVVQSQESRDESD